MVIRVWRLGNISSSPQVVAMVRDPTDRLWSDYLYFDRHDNRTPEHFRTQVPDQIARLPSFMTWPRVERIWYCSCHVTTKYGNVRVT